MKAIIRCRILILSVLLFHPLLCHGKPVNNDTSRIENGFPNDREYGALQLPITSDKKSVCMIDRRRLLNELDYVDGIEGRQSNVEIEDSPAFGQSSDSINSAQSSSYRENSEQSVMSSEGVSNAKESSSLSSENSSQGQAKDANEKLNTLMSIDEASLTQLEENNVHARVKRKSSSHKSKKSSSKKRSSKSSSKASAKSNASEDDSEGDELSDAADDAEKDYIAEEELRAIDEKDENERQSNIQDMDSFVEQDERSNLYDDFEAKDVAKRGVENAGDYEELQDDLPAPLNDAEFDEEAERHEEIRVKRQNAKRLESEARETASKEKRQSQMDNSEDARLDEEKLVSMSHPNNAKNDQLQELNSNLGTVKVSEDEVKSDLDSNAKDSAKSNDVKEMEPPIEYEKRSATKESEQKPAPITSLQALAQAEPETKSQATENQSGMRSERDINDQKMVKSDTNLSSICNETSNALTAIAKDQLSENTDKATDIKLTDEQASGQNSNLIDSTKSELASVSGDESDAEYQKRVEEQIQRKIDSIKEEIKRDIEENQRIREIEANNARFDELQTHEEEEDGQRVSSGRDIADNRSVAKRSAVETRKSGRKRDVGRKRRLSQNEIRRRLSEVESAERSDPIVDQKSRLRHEGIRKRSAPKDEDAEQTDGTRRSSARKKKREYARQVFLVRDAKGKRRKRRRSRNAILIPEQAHVKVEDELPADFVLSAQLRDPVANVKNGLSSSTNAEGGLPDAVQSLAADGKADALASLTGSSQELSPRLATEYKEAFGGLQDKPDGALARFKRIKRVLGRSPSKS